jgi:hypothetical protein
MRALDELYLKHPYFGSRRMALALGVNRKRAVRLLTVAAAEESGAEPAAVAEREIAARWDRIEDDRGKPRKTGG